MLSRNKPKSKAPALMLTSLLDMFTIILIFLIVSFEAESYDFRLNSEISLPESSSGAKLKPAVNVVISQGKILVNDKMVDRLIGGELALEHHKAQAVPQLVDALKKEYDLKYGKNAVHGANVGEGQQAEDHEPIVVLQADQKINYRTLYLVLRSAAQAGFFKYRLAIIKS